MGCESRQAARRIWWLIVADSASGRVSASADNNAHTTDDPSIPPFLDRTAEALTPEQLAGQPAIISPCAAVGTISVPAQVLTLTRRIKALIEKGDRAAEKAEQFYKSAGIHIKEIKEQSEDWETIVRDKCGLGRSRAYELMAIADGKTTLEKLRERSNTSSRVSHAKKSAEQRTAAPAVARATGSDEIDVDQRREQMAELDQSGEKTVDDVDRRVSCVFNTILRHVKGLSRCETERFLAVLRGQIDNIERDLRDVMALAEAAS
jgi:hypothetical protein